MRRFLFLFLAALLMSGCGKNTPDDELTATHIRPLAESGVAGVETVDFQRDNGWVDPQSENRYIVRYKYNYELKHPLFDIVLAKAKDERGEGDGEGFNQLDGAYRWEMAQDSSQRSARVDAMKAKCPACAAWLSRGSEEEMNARMQCFEDVWYGLEQAGFKDTDVAGAKTSTPRTAWATFVKTEKGWEAAS